LLALTESQLTTDHSQC